MGIKNLIYRVSFLFVCILTFVAFSGCSEKESEIVYYDIESDVDTVFMQDRSREPKGMVLGMQYYQGEPVQLRSDWMEGDKVYLARTDGSREDLMEIPHAKSMHCYLDREGNVYCWEKAVGIVPDTDPVVWMYDSSGREVCRVNLEKGTVPQDSAPAAGGRDRDTCPGGV